MVYAKKKNKAKKRTTDVAQPAPAEEIIGVVDRGVHAVAAQWKPIAIVIGGTALILSIVAVYQWVRENQEDEAAGMLYDAELKLPDASGFSFDLTGEIDGGDPEKHEAELREAIASFEAVSGEFGTGIGGDLARLESAHALLALQDFEGAAARYDEAADSESDLVRTLALNGQATALESLERYADEQLVLRELMDAGAGPVIEHAYLDLIRAHELDGDDDGALAACREFEEKLPDSPLITEVQGKIRKLGGEAVTTPETDAEDNAS
ncbi:MAG: hypothetical protein QGH45_18790 [Myxococcota bacterium]|jgi:tetratricopeptide (TPR) repeat protein|nr:hypothetical protein [Myxococcota bacterium]